MQLLPSRFPRPVRLALYALATAILLYLCLAPQKDLPAEPGNDKFEHATAWFVLTATGYLLAPRRARAIPLYAIALGGLVEILQAVLPFGRDGEWPDLAADAVGVAAAVGLYALASWLARR